MYNNYPATGQTMFGTVTAVDMVRGVCKCVTDTGDILVDVRWVVPTGGGDGYGTSYHPVENSRVLIDKSTGFPMITGSILTDAARDLRRQNIGVQDEDEPDIADYTVIKTGTIVRGPGTPRDQKVGDIVTTTDGGGLLGLLASGTAVIKSSPLAQTIHSRFGDLVRTISRNFEHFTDVDSTYKVSIRNKVFGIREFFRTAAKSRTENPSFVRYEGDVAWGETIGKTYADYTKDTFPKQPGIPEDGDKIIKEYTYNDANQKTSTFTESVEGATHREINNPDSTSTTLQNATNQQIDKSVTGGATARWRMNESEFFWESGTENDGVSVRGTAASGMVIQSATGAAKITLNNDGTIVIDGGATTFNVGATTFNCSGDFNVTAPTINLN